MAKTRRKKGAPARARPLAILAQAMGVKADTLRARLLYHGQKLKGATVAQLIKTLQEHSRDKLPRKVLRLLEDPAPEVRVNPDSTGPPIVPDLDTETGLLALEQANALAESNVGSGMYGHLEISILLAAAHLLPEKRRRKKR